MDHQLIQRPRMFIIDRKRIIESTGYGCSPSFSDDTYVDHLISGGHY